MAMPLRHKFFAVALMTAIPAGIHPALAAGEQPSPASSYWRGGYFGPVFTLHKLRNTYDPAKPLGFRKLKAKGQAIGGLAGYNFLYKDFMLGLEAEAAKGSIFDDDLSFVSTFRTRIGKPLGYSLPFVTGGVAVAGLKKSIVSSPLKVSGAQFGLVVGAGYERVIANAITGRLEYTYGHFFANGTPNTPRLRLKNLHMFRASIAIHLRD